MAKDRNVAYFSSLNWESFRQCALEIGDVAGDPELGRDVEQGPGPHDCAEALVISLAIP